MNPSTTTTPAETQLTSPPLSSTLPKQASPPSRDRAWTEEEKQAKDKIKETVRQTSTEAAERIKLRTEETVRDVKDRSSDFVCRQKDKAAERLADYEKALKAAAKKLHEGRDDHLSPYVEHAADQLGRVAGYLTAREPEELFHDAERFARRNPELVLGTCVVVGLALGRFLKASRRRTN